MNNDYKTNGYFIATDVLTKDEVYDFRALMDDYLNKNPSFNETGNSKILSGFAGNTPELGKLNLLHEDGRIHKILCDFIFENNKYIFASHSDLHQNKTTGWHRDTYDYLLKDRGNGTEEGLWSDDCHIIKVCFLLQDHTNNDYGLWFKPGTHRKGVDNRATVIYSKATDMIVFDQRILHSGQTQKPRYDQKFKANRYLLTFAFGLDNNHTKIHAKGAALRQGRQKNAFQ